jgi:serine/alanine racemase
MNEKNAFTGIDGFRLIAALLVVSIHTSPLASLNPTADFILTRILARVAVPFFFMTSGFFLLSRYSKNADKLKTFLRKTALLYLAAVALYLPLNLYAGYFHQAHLLPNLLKDLLVDGTFYHLWYLPAALLGAALSWLLVRRWGFGPALALSALLYALGLLGDSYYGLAQRVPALASLYDALFEVMDYTRNGLFFAPLLFVLGGFLADREAKPSLAVSLAGFALSLALLLCEGMTLRRLGWPRHDSMYLLLPICAAFLFSALRCFHGRRLPLLRDAALLLYLLHPMGIVAVRLLAKVLKRQDLLIGNSLVHFLCVAVLSLGGALLAAFMGEKRRAKHRVPQRECDRAWIEIDLDNLRHNARQLQAALPPGCKLMAVLKANAYGHGAFAVAASLERMGVRDFAVATAQEGVQLRRYGIRGSILVLGPTDPARARELRRYRLTQTLLDAPYAQRLDRQGVPVQAQIKVDTGMHRLGFDAGDVDAIVRAFALRRVRITGLYTHLCAADRLTEADAAFTRGQLSRFACLTGTLSRRGIRLPALHVQSSEGLLNYPELSYDFVRAGIALYGVASAPDDDARLALGLRPVLELKARVALVRSVRAGETVGYGRAFRAARDSVIAVLSIGYADGVPRSLSDGKGEVLLRGRRAPIAGRICMDQLAVDATDVPGVKVGDVAVLIGSDGGETLAAPEVAARAGAISNELLSRLGARLSVVTRGG